MGVVTESNVQAALTYLADDPHPVAIAVKLVADAENECDATFARVYLSASGGAELRKQIAADHADVQAAKEALAEAKRELQRHRSRIHAADCLLEIFRTENANARAAEKIR